jgi:hypothetical protein
MKTNGKKHKKCEECKCDLTFCEKCGVWHHTDSFKEEHSEFENEVIGRKQHGSKNRNI